MKTYCLVCKKLTNLKNLKNKGRLMMKSICLVCGNKKFRLILEGSGLFIVLFIYIYRFDSLGLNVPQNRIKNSLWNGFI